MGTLRQSPRGRYAACCRPSPVQDVEKFMGQADAWAWSRPRNEPYLGNLYLGKINCQLPYAVQGEGGGSAGRGAPPWTSSMCLILTLPFHPTGLTLSAPPPCLPAYSRCPSPACLPPPLAAWLPTFSAPPPCLPAYPRCPPTVLPAPHSPACLVVQHPPPQSCLPSCPPWGVLASPSGEGEALTPKDVSPGIALCQ